MASFLTSKHQQSLRAPTQPTSPTIPTAPPPRRGTKKAPPKAFADGGAYKKRRPPTLPHCGAVPSAQPAIGAAGLNFSVRDGKRWNPGAMATWNMAFDNAHTRPANTTEGGRPCNTDLADGPAPADSPAAPGSFRAISSARLWRRRLYTCALSTS